MILLLVLLEMSKLCNKLLVASTQLCSDVVYLRHRPTIVPGVDESNRIVICVTYNNAPVAYRSCFANSLVYAEIPPPTANYRAHTNSLLLVTAAVLIQLDNRAACCSNHNVLDVHCPLHNIHGKPTSCWSSGHVFAPKISHIH